MKNVEVQVTDKEADKAVWDAGQNFPWRTEVAAPAAPPKVEVKPVSAVVHKPVPVEPIACP